jgi:hypothetical protein
MNKLAEAFTSAFFIYFLVCSYYMHKYGTIAVIDTLLFTKKQTKTRDREG